MILKFDTNTKRDIRIGTHLISGLMDVAIIL